MLKHLSGDHLGSPRVVTNSSGALTARRDYMPFGEELFAGTGGRTTGMGFSSGGADTNRKKFTGYERDTETGLDFAQARYNSSTQGRFTSPDPLQSSAKTTDPQSWNRYAYCSNNPVKFIDPSGMSSEIGGRSIHNSTWASLAEEHAQGLPEPQSFGGEDDTFRWNASAQQQQAQEQQQQEPQGPAEVVKMNANDPKILDYSVKYINSTSQGEAPVGRAV